jgi:hypothetical protein
MENKICSICSLKAEIAQLWMRLATNWTAKELEFDFQQG